MQRKSKIILTLLAILVSSFVVVFVGPFTFYATVVPYLAPVLPRPDGVPRSAEASYSWKGFGLYWEWQKEFPSGCASWGATKTINYSTVRLVTSNAGCNSAGLSLRHDRGDDFVVFDVGGNDMDKGRCPFEVSLEQVKAFRELVGEAKKSASNHIERPALNRIETRLRSIDGTKLTVDYSGGCSDRSLKIDKYPQ